MVNAAMHYTLYGIQRSGSFSIEAALAEAGQSVQLIDIDIYNDQQHTDDYRALNPVAKLPTLRLPDGQLLTESAAILLTLADRHPGLLPTGTPAHPDRPQALRWLLFLATEVYAAIEWVDYPERLAPDAPDPLRQRLVERLRQRWLLLEAAISGDPWLLPSGFSAVDIYIANLSRWSLGREWRDANLPRVQRLTRAVTARPAIAPIWARHFPDQVG